MIEKMEFYICMYFVCILLLYPDTIQSTPTESFASRSDWRRCMPNCNHPGPIDCEEIRSTVSNISGIYRIWPLNWETVGSFLVDCDMITDGGGWTVFQRRGDYGNPTDYFYRDWKSYALGFGDLNEDFWLGNDRIFSLTNQGRYSLRIDMKDLDGNKRFAQYRNFWIENEPQQYRLHVSGYSGDAGDSLLIHNGQMFSTKDRENDIAVNENCAVVYKGAWWHSWKNGGCHQSNLNGLYLNGPHESYADGINWLSWKGHYYSLPQVDMKIRRQ